MRKRSALLVLLMLGFMPVHAADSDAAYFPWQPSCKWTYKTINKAKQKHFEMKVWIEGPWKENGKSGMIMTQKDERGTMRQYLESNDKGVFMYQIGLSKSFTPEVFTHFTPSVPMLIFPMVPGTKVHWEGQLKVAWVDKHIVFDGEVLNSESVTVPAGTYTCLKVHYHEKRGDEVIDETAWYASGVGQVKYDGGQYIKELTSFTGS